MIDLDIDCRYAYNIIQVLDVIKNKKDAANYCIFGAADRGRTGMVSLPLDFESSASANSTTAAYPYLLYINDK